MLFLISYIILYILILLQIKNLKNYLLSNFFILNLSSIKIYKNILYIFIYLFIFSFIFFFCINIYLYLIIFVFFTNIIILHIRFLGLEIFFFFYEKKKVDVMAPIDFIFKFFGLKGIKIYVFLKKSISKISNFFFLFFLYSCYNTLFFLVIYLMFSFLIDLDDFNTEFNQAVVGFYHNYLIDLKISGKNKVNAYIKFLLENYFINKYTSFRGKLSFDNDFFFLNKKDYEESLFSP